jgi:hypothetical protein
MRVPFWIDNIWSGHGYLITKSSVTTQQLSQHIAVPSGKLPEQEADETGLRVKQQLLSAQINREQLIVTRHGNLSCG